MKFSCGEFGSQQKPRHYAPAEHEGRKPFYDGLIAYITSAPVMAMVWERAERGRRDPPDGWLDQAGGIFSRLAINHDFALEVGRNLIHASDKPGGVREVGLWFKNDELVDWKRDVDRWVFEK
ncbi:MAG: nucleoside-diphosphate kinase [Anaerolineales bacterium]